MEVINRTDHDIEDLIRLAVADIPVDGLKVEVKYSPKTSRLYASGTYYRRTKKHSDGKLVRLRINRKNSYPIKMHFKTSEYTRKRTITGEVRVYQKIVEKKVKTPEHLLVAVFLHELSHYLDHFEGRNGRYKETKADKFAYNRLVELGII